MTTPSFSLKDYLLNQEKIEILSFEIHNSYTDFSRENFCITAVSKFPELELKERITWISNCLSLYLPKDYKTALSIILNALPEPCDPTRTDDDFGSFIYAPYAHFVESHGCKEPYVDISLSALEELTTRFSVEFSIRKFITLFPEKTYLFLKKWSRHPHYHVRRLVSEGTRPSLPWAKKIHYEPDRYLPLLDHLFKDNTRFVTRSVANHLNDVSKFSPNLVIQTLKKWQKGEIQSQKEMKFIRNHSLRTLIKQGNQTALEFLGFNKNPSLHVELVLNKTEIFMGDRLNFKTTITSHNDEHIVIDYIMTFQTKRKTPSEKAFKLKSVYLKKGESISFSKHYTFKPNMSTRTFYPGTHKIQLQINGTKQSFCIFNLHEAIKSND